MDGILGIVSEYNPFHNGHIHHLQLSKKATKTDFSVAVMSGNFVERGDTSIVNKWIKAEMALKAGIDLVIELPTVYAISSAENFADGAIKILNGLGVVDYVSFGSEIGEISPLNDIASILYKEPKDFSTLLKSYLASGVSYPKARELALSQYFGTSKKYIDILNNPNNILAIEYIKSLKKHRSHIIPVTVKRDYSEYNSKKVKKGIASSTAIREMIKNNQNVHYVVPYETYELLEEAINTNQIITDLSVFEKEIIYALRKLSLTDIANLPDVSEGLENKIKQSANNYNTLSELISNIKSKRYTQTRIQRILLYALLDITKKDINFSKRATPYIRVLGFNKHGKRIISAIAKANPRLNIIVSVKKFMENSNSPGLRNMMAKDILASNIYTLGYKTNPIANLDYTHKVIEI